MATQTIELDPNAQAYTDDEIVGKINTASVAITRESALSIDDLKIVKTNAGVGEYRLKYFRLSSDKDIVVVYNETAET